jgi:hypothetical protein
VRFCPFCSAENADEVAVCASCGRRLPPLPPRRGRQAGTGVQLPPRATSPPPPRPITVAPDGAARGARTQTIPPPSIALPSLAPTPIAAAAPITPAAPIAPAPAIETEPAPLAPPPPAPTLAPTMPPPLAPTVPPLAPAPVVAPAPTPTVPPLAPSPAPRPATATNPPALAPVVAPAPRPATATSPPALASVPRPATATSPPALVSLPRTGSPTGSPTGAPRAGSTTQAPPLASVPRPVSTTQPPPPGAAQPGVMVTSAGFPPVARAPAPAPTGDDAARGLATALSPSPAAQRREPPPPEPVESSGLPSGLGRRKLDAPTPAPAATPAPAPTAYPRASADLMRDAGLPVALAIDATRSRDDGIEPPPTRIHRPEALVDRPFAPPKVSPVPEIPEPGLVPSARYTFRFVRARWQRRGAIKLLGADIKKDTDALDQVLGALGGMARTAKVDGRVFFGENAAINAAEDRVAVVSREHNDVDARKVEENSKFVDIERERNAKLGEAERMVDEAQKELAQLEAQRRNLRDKRKELERRQKAYLKAAEDNDKQSGATELGGDQRQELRRAADESRREAAALEPERQDVDRRLAGIDRPISEVAARLDAAKAELDAAKRSLADAREGHTHRLAELDAEQKRKAREIAQAEGEIARRLVTLGTLVNLNRIEDPRFTELYDRIDRLRGAITARTTEIEKLTAEREAYDRGTLVRGVSVLGGAVVIFIALIVILRAILRS